MGTYLNPGNSGFERIIKGQYIDKSGMISVINERIGTTDNLFCISRPRRFGKSFAAQMLCAYYDKTCDSSALFDSLICFLHLRSFPDRRIPFINDHDKLVDGQLDSVNQSRGKCFICFQFRIGRHKLFCHFSLDIGYDICFAGFTHDIGHIKINHIILIQMTAVSCAL